MKKILNKNLIGIILISFGLLSCDRIPDGIVDVTIVDYKILGITAPAAFIYSQADSTVLTSLKLANAETVSSVWCKVSSLDGTLTIKNQVPMYDDGNVSLHGDQTKGDGIYSAKFVMGKLIPIGKYQIEYFIEDNINHSPDNLKKIGAHIFTFSPGQINLPPKISNLVIPNSVNRGEAFVFTVKVEDPNGLMDVVQVFYKLYRPDGTVVYGAPNQDYIIMDDSGDQRLGDQIAGDGVYSYKNSFGNTSLVGKWHFEFQAVDRSNVKSNIITFDMTVN